MALRPLHDRVLLRRLDGEEKTKGGIIPDTAKEKSRSGARTVLIRTRGCWAENSPIRAVAA
jgi:co-chaperonin GroES (HSP10)